MQSILVRQPSDLTIDWAQRVVNKHFSHIVVSNVDIVSVDIGTTTRIRVNVEHNEPTILSGQWFVKLPSMAWQAKLITALPRLLHTEVRFYNEVARSVSVTVPNFLAAQSRLGRGATLVLTDMTELGTILGSPEDALTFPQAALVVEQLANFHARAPQTLVHHDCHAGDLFWNQSQPGLLDWQLVRFGEGISDIDYFLSTALNPETRRLHEANLIAIYAQGLEDNGVTGIDVKILLQRYRAHLVYPFEAMIITLAIGGMMNLKSNHELIRRTAAAVEDLEAFAAMPI